MTLLRAHGIVTSVVALPGVYRHEVDEMAGAGGGVIDAPDFAQLVEVMPAAVRETAVAPPPARP